MILVSPTLDESSKKQVIKFIEETVAASSGKIANQKDYGRKELAYPIKKQNEADYFYFELDLEPAAVLPIDKKIKINEGIIRYLFVKKEKVRPIKIKKTKETEKLEEKPTDKKTTKKSKKKEKK